MMHPKHVITKLPDGQFSAAFLGQPGTAQCASTARGASLALTTWWNDYYAQHNPAIQDAEIEKANAVRYKVYHTEAEYLQDVAAASVVCGEDWNRSLRRLPLLSPFEEIDNLMDYYQVDVGDNQGGFWETWDGRDDDFVYDYTKVRLRRRSTLTFPSFMVMRPGFQVHEDFWILECWPLADIQKAVQQS